MNLYTVAIGRDYEEQANRLQESLVEDVNIFSIDSIGYEKTHINQTIDGLFHKTNFANYIEDVEGPIVFLDADAFAVERDVLKDFHATGDIGYVPYKGKWHLPDGSRQRAYNFTGHKINSGFLYFKDLETAKEICTLWNRIFVERVIPEHEAGRHEYDEWALMEALMNISPTIVREMVDGKWNDWELLHMNKNLSLVEIKGSESLILQSHDYMNILT